MDTITDSPVLDPLLNELRGVAFEMGAVFALRKLVASIAPVAIIDDEYIWEVLRLASEEARERYK